jgi:hypothetical protein
MINIDEITEKNTQSRALSGIIDVVDKESITSLNIAASYDFDPINDIQIISRNNNHEFKFSINANIPLMINSGIKLIRVILSESGLTELKLHYEPGEIINEFYFNVHDYFDIRKETEIAKNKRIKTINLSNFSNSIVSYTHNREDLIDLTVKKRGSLGTIFSKHPAEINKYFAISRNTSDNDIIEVAKETVLMTHLITQDLNAFFRGELHIKIVEMSSKSSGAFADYLLNHSIYDFTLEFNEIERKTMDLYWEANNKLNASGVNNKTTSLHELNIDNEIFDSFEILEKSSLKEGFTSVTGEKLIRANEHNYKIRNTVPTIYRVIDSKQKLRDVFVGDLKKHLFDSNPSIHAFTLNNSVSIIVKNVPKDFLYYIVYRYEESNKKKKIVVTLNESSDFNFFYENIMALQDPDVFGNKSYGYQIKFITNNSTEILTNISNRAKFIQPSGSFSLDAAMTSEVDENKIIFTTTVPITDSQKIYESIRYNFPDINEEIKNTLVENYSFLSFVKLMAIDLRSGNIIMLETKPSQSNKIEFNVSDYGLDTTYYSFFGEMFANSIISILENMNSSARYQNPSNDYIPPTSYNISELGLDPDNFMSKFISYSSMNDGTLTYGRALASEPGSLIESAKTGVITIVNRPEFPEADSSLSYTKEVKINNRNIPTISIKFTQNIPESVLVVASSEKGIVFRIEKGISPEGEMKFFDLEAQTDFLNEIIDYFIIPVYNNYNIKSIIKVGTIICSKDNFRSI